MMEKRKLVASFLIAAGVVGAGAGCGGRDNDPAPPPTPDTHSSSPSSPPPLPPPPPQPSPPPVNDHPLKKAEALAEWALGKPYSQDMSERDCTASDNPGNGFPDAPVPGPPSSTGHCAQYDCSSLVTWILRQIPNQTAVEPVEQSNVVHNTFWMWTGDTENTDVGPTPPNTPSPTGWAPCDPTKDAVCVGFTEWGEGYQGKASVPGPGHVIISLEGTVYSAPGDPVMAYRDWPKPDSGNEQGTGRQKVVWVKPPGV